LLSVVFAESEILNYQLNQLFEKLAIVFRLYFQQIQQTESGNEAQWIALSKICPYDPRLFCDTNPYQGW